MDEYKYTIKVSKVGKNFFERLIRNRIKADTDLTELSRGRIIELLLTYFTKYQDDYKKLLKMEYKKDA